MTLKFYLHDALNTFTAAEMPGSLQSVSATTPTRVDDIGQTRTMNGTIGTAQTSRLDTTAASTASQSAMIVRFTSPPIAAQTIAVQSITFAGAAAESNANSDFFVNWVLAVWRPSTASVVGLLYDLGTAGAEPGTTETTYNIARSTSSVTAQDGDVLILELWRSPNTQVMGTAYTNTYYYDGTTEGSATSNAAFIQFTNDVPLYTPKSSYPDQRARKIRANLVR